MISKKQTKMAFTKVEDEFDKVEHKPKFKIWQDVRFNKKPSFEVQFFYFF